MNKKTLFFIFFIFSILLIITSVIGTYLWTYFHSSEYVFDYSININKIEVKQSIIDELSNKYVSSEDIEVVYCLDGYRNNNVVRITGIYEPEVIQATGNQVIFLSCTGVSNVGTIHKHPSEICDLSREDTFVFGKTNDLLMGIVCGQDNFVFFPPTDLNNGINPTII